MERVDIEKLIARIRGSGWPLQDADRELLIELLEKNFPKRDFEAEKKMVEDYHAGKRDFPF